jgi:hypothetical protein
LRRRHKLIMKMLYREIALAFTVKFVHPLSSRAGVRRGDIPIGRSRKRAIPVILIESTTTGNSAPDMRNNFLTGQSMALVLLKRFLSKQTLLYHLSGSEHDGQLTRYKRWTNKALPRARRSAPLTDERFNRTLLTRGKWG